jgi:hypothetical protein
MGDEFQDRWTKLGIQLFPVAPHLGRHLCDDLRHVRIDRSVIHPGALQHGPQNTYVSISVDGNALNAGFNAQHMAHRVLKGKVVDGVAAIEQDAVNIEQVGISRVPAKSGTHEYSFTGAIWSQI